MILIIIGTSAARGWGREGSGQVGDRGSAPKGGRHTTIFVLSSVKALLVKCLSVQWQPNGLTIHTKSVS